MWLTTERLNDWFTVTSYFQYRIDKDIILTVTEAALFL